METNPNIEDQVNRALTSVKGTEPLELPFGFSERVINKLHVKNNSVRSMYTISPLLKVAAMFILIIVNVFALQLALSPEPIQNTSQFVTIKDFVSEYQINNDANEELLTINTTTYEQR